VPSTFLFRQDIDLGLEIRMRVPMTMALMPVIRDRRHTRYQLYPAVHLLAMTGCAAAMRRCP
jgi:hypothetical protein